MSTWLLGSDKYGDGRELPEGTEIRKSPLPVYHSLGFFLSFPLLCHLSFLHFYSYLLFPASHYLFFTTPPPTSSSLPEFSRREASLLHAYPWKFHVSSSRFVSPFYPSGSPHFPETIQLYANLNLAPYPHTAPPRSATSSAKGGDLHASARIRR